MNAHACALCLALGTWGGQPHAACIGFDPEPMQAPPREVTAVTCDYAPYHPRATHHERQQLDVYRPRAANGAPVVLVVPGGGWIQGDKGVYHELGVTLSGFHGFVTVITNYRLSGPDGDGVTHPAHVHDVAAAFRWVKTHAAEYGGDPGRVFLFGQSAGAHLASLLSTDAIYLQGLGYGLEDIAGTVAMSGMYDLPALSDTDSPFGLTDEEVSLYQGMFFLAFGTADGPSLALASPQRYINADQPPFLVVYSVADVPGMQQGAEWFVSGFDQGLDVELAAITAYSSAVELEARDMADGDDPDNPALLADYWGHYAEMVAINTEMPFSDPTLLVVDFVNGQGD